MPEKAVMKVPSGIQTISSRQAALMLECSMGHVRYLRRSGRLKGWAVGGRFTMLDYGEVKSLARESDRARKDGTKRGAPSRGFSPDT